MYVSYTSRLQVVACWAMGVLHENSGHPIKAVGCYINAAVVLRRKDKEKEDRKGGSDDLGDTIRAPLKHHSDTILTPF
jgi:hypothetical protein